MKAGENRVDWEKRLHDAENARDAHLARLAQRDEWDGEPETNEKERKPSLQAKNVEKDRKRRRKERRDSEKSATYQRIDL